MIKKVFSSAALEKSIERSGARKTQIGRLRRREKHAFGADAFPILSVQERAPAKVATVFWTASNRRKIVSKKGIAMRKLVVAALIVVGALAGCASPGTMSSSEGSSWSTTDYTP